MKDIARELGVSVATVSRALNNSPSISEKQRQRIREYAEQHNFIPNILAKDLRNTNRMPIKLIGVILPEIVHYYFASILSGIEAEASRRGYRIMIAQSNEEYEREVSICKSYMEARVCGIILSQAKSTTNYDHFRYLQQQNIPLVFFDRICTGINASRVVIDDYNAAYTATEHLIQTGCRRIAFYGSDMKLEISKNRYNGYKDALRKYGMEIDNSIVVNCDNRQKAEEITPTLLSSSTPPDAFFAINDDTAVGILYVAKRMGLRVPQDVSISGFTNGNRAVACDPMLTTIDQHGLKVGAEAASILIDQVEGILPKNQVCKRIVKTILVKRGTTKG